MLCQWQINSQATLLETKYVKTYGQASDQPINSSEISESSWTFIKEPVGITKSSAFTKVGLLEQINTTADASDYLWYSTRCCIYICILVFRSTFLLIPVLIVQFLLFMILQH